MQTRLIGRVAAGVAFRLAPLQRPAHDRMDHQFVTLVSTDEKKTAVETFRSEPDTPRA